MSRSAPTPTDRRPRLLLAGALVLLGVGVAAAFLVWFVWFSSPAPAAPTIQGAAGALRTAEPSADVGVDPASTDVDPASTDTDPASAADRASTGALDGTWTVDTSLGSFEDFSSSWVGFRVNEVLSNIGDAAAVGRTPDVAATLEVAGSTLQNATIEVDLTTIKSDQSRRDPAIQRALETGDFPTATFESSEPVTVDGLSDPGGAITVTVPGLLTIHGVTQEVEAQMDVQVIDDVVAVVGSLPVDFTTFGVTMPTAPIVVSVEDAGTIEWQLFFRLDDAA